MRTSAYAVIPIVLALAVAMGVQFAQEPGRPNQNGSRGPAQHASLSIKWMPDWLAEPIQKAITDAHDPRDRER